MAGYLKIDDLLTHESIGCAMKVHYITGYGFQEVIYQHCLAIVMKKQGMDFVREQSMPIYYNGIKVGTRHVDFFVENKILVELKVLIKLKDVHLAQGLNYLEAFQLDVG
jgi:GxxExxY protein